MDSTTLTTLLNKDFCPSVDRYVFWLKKPLGVLVLAAFASLLCGLLVAPQGLVIAVTIAVTVMLGMIWPWIGLQGLSCELRITNRRGIEGQSSPVEVVVRNRWPFPVWGMVIEDGFFLSEDGEDGTAVALSGIRGWSKTTFCWRFQPECRGVYPRNQAKLATEFPFGVWKARRKVTTTGQLVVWPRTVPLAPAMLSDGRNRSLHSPSEKKSGNEGERIGVRAYREGDSLRFVHWAQTAKCGRLIVSERQGPAQSTAVVVIDTEAANTYERGPNSPFECAVRIAASICEQLTQQNLTVWMVVDGKSWEVQPNALSRRHAMDRLSSVTPSTHSQRKDSERLSTLGRFGKCDARFFVTTSSLPNKCGPEWKRIVLTDSRPEPNHVISDPGGDWIVVDNGADSLMQFSLRWDQAVRHSWRRPARRAGVA